MSEIEQPPRADLSRRKLLMRVALVSGGAALAIGGLTAATGAAAITKVSQKTAGYRGDPNGKARCDGCNLWQAPASCKMVDGPISAAGWCNLYAAK
jgi:hypothetical protein